VVGEREQSTLESVLTTPIRRELGGVPPLVILAW
jgi:hypothetical protein